MVNSTGVLEENHLPVAHWKEEDARARSLHRHASTPPVPRDVDPRGEPEGISHFAPPCEGSPRASTMKLAEILSLAQVPSLLVMGAVYMAYVLIGGVVFWKLEGNLGKEDVSAILVRKQQVLKTYDCLNSDGIDAVIQVRRPLIEARVICDAS